MYIHSSYKKLSNGFQTTPEKILEEFRDISKNLVFPSFNWDSTIDAPKNDRIKKNAINYNKKWISKKIPFNKNLALADKKMGILARLASQNPQAQRYNHPWYAWSVLGPLKWYLTKNSNWENPYDILKKGYSNNGWVLLCGVELRDCTAFHLADELAGFKQFTRWAIDYNKKIRRLKIGGCPDWIENHRSEIEKWCIIFWHGQAKIYLFRLKPVIDLLVRRLKENPTSGVCLNMCKKCTEKQYNK